MNDKTKGIMEVALYAARMYSSIVQRLCKGGLTEQQARMYIGVLMGLELTLSHCDELADVRLRFMTVDQLLERGILKIAQRPGQPEIPAPPVVEVPTPLEIEGMLRGILKNNES